MQKLFLALTVSAYCAPAAVLLFFATVSLMQSEIVAYIMVGVLALCWLLSWSLSLASMVKALRAAKTARPLPPFAAVCARKLRMIPFFVLHFVSAFLMGMMLLGPWGMIMIPIVCCHIWWIMMGFSAHNLAGLYALRKQGQITSAQCLLHCAAQLVFGWDLIDSVWLKKEFKPNSPIDIPSQKW